MIYHLLLGSNMQNPPQQLAQALLKISELPELTLCRKTDIVVSKPYGKTDQDDFCNMVLEIESSLSPDRVLEQMLAIEQQMGRVRIQKWGPRTIDIDILLAEDTVLNTADICLPHYDLHNRAFALALLCELVPDAIHPILHKTMRELLQSLPGGNT